MLAPTSSLNYPYPNFLYQNRVVRAVDFSSYHRQIHTRTLKERHTNTAKPSFINIQYIRYFLSIFKSKQRHGLLNRHSHVLKANKVCTIILVLELKSGVTYR